MRDEGKRNSRSDSMKKLCEICNLNKTCQHNFDFICKKANEIFNQLIEVFGDRLKKVEDLEKKLLLSKIQKVFCEGCNSEMLLIKNFRNKQYHCYKCGKTITLVYWEGVNDPRYEEFKKRGLTD